MSVIYTLESLKALNTVFDTEYRLDQRDVDIVNRSINLIEKSRSDKPCVGDVIEHTNRWGEYSPNAHIQDFNAEIGQFSVYLAAHVPFIFTDSDGEGMEFCSRGGNKVFVDAVALTYIGRREKLFKVFGHCGVAGHGSVCFKASVNVWKYIDPVQQHPGYSTKDWAKQLINSNGEAYYGHACSHYGQDVAFRNAEELRRWKETYRAVEFPGYCDKQRVFFLYREKEKLLSREEWDSLGLPLDTRIVSGVIHVKVAYDDKTHMVTAYRFTNCGYLNPQRYGPYEKAKGAVLFAP